MSLIGRISGMNGCLYCRKRLRLMKDVAQQIKNPYSLRANSREEFGRKEGAL